MDYLAHALDGYDLYFISIFAITTLAFATPNRLLAVFLCTIFAVLLKLENTSNIGNLRVSSNSLQNVQTHSRFFNV